MSSLLQLQLLVTSSGLEKAQDQFTVCNLGVKLQQHNLPGAQQNTRVYVTYYACHYRQLHLNFEKEMDVVWNEYKVQRNYLLVTEDINGH